LFDFLLKDLFGKTLVHAFKSQRLKITVNSIAVPK